MMKRIVLIILLLCSCPAFAVDYGYRLAHPVGWGFGAQTSETPGWKTKSWFNMEFAQSNIWNIETNFVNINTGDLLTYEFDYEQSHLIFNFGEAVSETLAWTAEVPMHVHGGGILDGFVDDFHIAVDSERFNRQYYDENNFVRSVKVNGQERLTNLKYFDLPHIKLGLKWWPWQLQGNCACGWSTQVSAKLPIAAATTGGSSGTLDLQAGTSFGFHILEMSSIYFNSSVTYIGDSELWRGWPINRWQQMHSATLRMVHDDKWSLVAELRVESPFMEKDDLLYVDTNAGTEEERIANRMASAHHSLIFWRTSQSIGFERTYESGARFKFQFVEDIGFGDRDGIGDPIFVGNAPDMAFVFQYSIPMESLFGGDSLSLD